MSAQRVLSAAAVLGEFSLTEVEAFCDEPRSVIVDVLESAGDAVARTVDEETSEEVWRVLDLEGVRQQARSHTVDDYLLSPRCDPESVELSTATQLQYAEETLLDTGQGRSVDERRVRLGTAKNHLRQVVSKTAAASRPWWEIELAPVVLEGELSGDTDSATRTRLQLDAEVVYLAERDLTGASLSTQDLVGSIVRLQPLTEFIDRQHMHAVVIRFFDLVLAQAVPNEDCVDPPGRLLTGLARRRIKAQLNSSLDGALRALVPLLTNVGRERGDRPPELYEVIEYLPAGRQHVVVYRDLLDMLPQQFGWQTRTERLPGTLIEAVTESDTADHLRMCARTLERDLHSSPYGSEPALIGSAVHVFQQLAALSSGFDRSLTGRSDRTCSELLSLARVALR